MVVRFLDSVLNVVTFGRLKIKRNAVLALASAQGDLKKVICYLKTTCCNVNSTVVLNAHKSPKADLSACPLLWAVRNGHSAIAQLLVIGTKSEFCAAAFVEACSQGYVQIAKHLLPRLKADFSKAVNTGFVLAIKGNHQAIISLLMFDRRISPNFVVHPFEGNQTENSTFVLACEYNNQAVVENFLTNKCLKLKKAGRFGIFAAARNNHWELVRFLLSYPEVYDKGRFPIDHEGKHYRLFLVNRMNNELTERTFGLNDKPQNKNHIDLDTVSAGAIAQKHLELEGKILETIFNMIEKKELPFDPITVLFNEPEVIKYFRNKNARLDVI